MNKLPTEVAAYVGGFDPASVAAGTVYSSYIPMALFRRFLAALKTGAMTANSTVDAKIIAYTSGAGANPTDVTGTTITQLTQAGTDGSKVVLINLNVDKVSRSLKFTHFRVQVVVATAASLLDLSVWGFDPRYDPAADNDIAAVDEIVSN